MGEGSPGCNTHPIDRLTYLLTQRSGHGGPMARRSGASDPRRTGSPRRTSCALVALAWLLLAVGPRCAAQGLRLEPGSASASASTGAAVPDELPLPHDAAVASEEDVGAPPPRRNESGSRAGAALGGATSQVAKKAGVSASLRTALDRPGDLNLHDVQLRAALFMISEQWGINVVCGAVTGTVNGVLRQAPLRETLDSILLSNGYNYRAVGESLVISSVQDLGQINPFFESATIPVHSADIDEVVASAKLLTTPQGQVQAVKSARSIVVLDFPDRVEMIREFVRSIDGAPRAGLAGGGARAGQPLEVGYFRTQHIAAKTAEDALQAVMSKEGRVAVMEKEDRLPGVGYAGQLGAGGRGA